MTAQFSQGFINHHPDFILEGFNLYCILVTHPDDENWAGYTFKSKPDPTKLNVFSACWNGYVNVYELSTSGTLALIKIEYPSLGGVITPDAVYEILEGDFWLEFRDGFFDDILYVPFVKGQLLKEKETWVSEKNSVNNLNKVNNTSVAKKSWLASLRKLFKLPT